MGGMLLVAVLWSIVFLFVAAALLQWLWNITLPEVLGASAVGYWQAFRLLLIATLLFGGPPTFLHFNS
jgi:hypothetical protein